MTGLGLIVTYNIKNSLTDIIKQKCLDMFMFTQYFKFQNCLCQILLDEEQAADEHLL